MAFTIGERIKKRAKELRIGPTELGEMINTSKQNIYGIYKRKSLDTETLRKLSVALNFDFFEYYRIEDKKANKNNEASTLNKNKKGVSVEEYEKLKAAYENLKEKYDLLKKVNLLLEKKK